MLEKRCNCVPSCRRHKVGDPEAECCGIVAERTGLTLMRPLVVAAAGTLLCRVLAVP